MAALENITPQLNQFWAKLLAFAVLLGSDAAFLKNNQSWIFRGIFFT